ncbi:MAG: HAD-IA family hydrolase [Candidatus Aenigmatarchaeota archaeon]
MQIKAVIFDFDQVLIDSYKDHLDAFLLAAKKFRIKLNKEEIYKGFGKSAKELVKSQHPELPEKFLEKFVMEKEKIYREILKKRGAKLMKGAREILKFLKKRKIKIALSSSASRKNINLSFKVLKIRKYFDVVVASEDVKKHKPNPEPLLKAAKRLRVNPKNCIYLGDSIYEMMAAKRAKMAAIGILSGIYTIKDLQKYKPLKIVKNLLEAKTFLEKIL